YPLGDLSVSGPTVGRIIFDTAESRRIMRWRDDDAVCEPSPATPVIAKNGVRDYRSRSVAIAGIYHHLDAICHQDLQGGGKSGLGKRVRIHTDVKRSVDVLLFAIKANRLRDGQKVHLVERPIKCRAAMARRSERDALRRY